MAEKRPALVKRTTTGGNYFASLDKPIDFFSTGCTPLDCAMGGGWAESRIGNIVGDSSTGKSLLTIEAAANFARKYPQPKNENIKDIFHREVERAWDDPYAEALGFPLKRIDKKSIYTIEDMFNDVHSILDRKLKYPNLYIVDSLDALSDADELDAEFEKGTFGAKKAKLVSRFFRQLNQRMAEQKLTMLIVSQVRDKIGLTIGKKHTRSGGKALQFYCSQIVWLSHLGRIKKTVNKIERVIGVDVRAMLDKNKVGLPFRNAEFELKFGFGMDDVDACIRYLQETNGLDKVGLAAKAKKGADGKMKAPGEKEQNALLNKYREECEALSSEDYQAELVDLRKAVRERFTEVETSFLPTRRKYG